MRIYQRKNRDDCWWVDYADPNGKRHRERIGPDKALAEAVLAKLKTEIIEGRYFDMKKQEKKVLFDDFCNEYIEEHSQKRKRPMVAKRDKGLVKHLMEHFKGKYLSDITPKMIENYQGDRIQKAAPATVNREIACLKHMFNKAILWEEATDNPVRKVKLFRENNMRKRYLDQEQIIKFIDACSPHLKPIALIALHTGMRKAEILELKWNEVDLDQGIIYILQPKSGERREVWLNEVAKKTLRELKRHPKSPYVFYRKNGKAYYNVRKSFDAALKKCGIIDFRFHDLRHTFASQLAMAGESLKTIQELLGHKTPEMTHRYAHLSPSHKRNAVEVLAQRIGTQLAPEKDSSIVEQQQPVSAIA
jgi:integrase